MYMGMEEGSAGNYSYYLGHTTSGTVTMGITDDGTTFDTVTSTATTSGWTFAVGRFDPSTELAVFVNGVKAVNTSSIDASIYDGNGNFNIGAWAGSLLLTGDASICFLCAAYLSDDMIGALFQQSRALYGV